MSYHPWDHVRDFISVRFCYLSPNTVESKLSVQLKFSWHLKTFSTGCNDETFIMRTYATIRSCFLQQLVIFEVMHLCIASKEKKSRDPFFVYFRFLTLSPTFRNEKKITVKIIFSFLTVTDWAKCAFYDSAIQGINWPWSYLHQPWLAERVEDDLVHDMHCRMTS